MQSELLISLVTVHYLLLSACSSPRHKVTPPNWGRVPVSIELRLATSSPGPGLEPAVVYAQSDTVYLHSDVQLSNRDIARVEAAKTMGERGLVLAVWHRQSGAQRIADLTARHIGDSMAIVIQGVVVAVPIIEEKINPGTKLPTHIGVPLGAKEAAQLAQAVSRTWPAPVSAPRRLPSPKAR